MLNEDTLYELHDDYHCCGNDRSNSCTVVQGFLNSCFQPHAAGRAMTGGLKIVSQNSIRWNLLRKFGDISIIFLKHDSDEIMSFHACLIKFE